MHLPVNPENTQWHGSHYPSPLEREQKHCFLWGEMIFWRLWQGQEFYPLTHAFNHHAKWLPQSPPPTLRYPFHSALESCLPNTQAAPLSAALDGEWFAQAAGGWLYCKNFLEVNLRL